MLGNLVQDDFFGDIYIYILHQLTWGRIKEFGKIKIYICAKDAVTPQDVIWHLCTPAIPRHWLTMTRQLCLDPQFFPLSNMNCACRSKLFTGGKSARSQDFALRPGVGGFSVYCWCISQLHFWRLFLNVKGHLICRDIQRYFREDVFSLGCLRAMKTVRQQWGQPRQYTAVLQAGMSQPKEWIRKTHFQVKTDKIFLSIYSCSSAYCPLKFNGNTLL